MTGRAAGYCAGYSVPGFMNPVSGRGFGGWGGGWGRRNWFYAAGLPGWQPGAYWLRAFGSGVPYTALSAGPYAPPFGSGVTREREIEGLKGQAEYLEDALDAVKKRIEELESKSENK
jgi:hypothetical protein